jgi:hypothetical protein
MLDNNRNKVVVCVLLAIVAFHMAVAWQDFATLARNGYLYDDSFYAFQIARNIAAGNGMTFDGIHPTTGFQPLYVFLLVPVFMAAGGNSSLAIHIALSMLALFTGMTFYALYRISRRYVGFAASIIAASIWAFSPIVVRQTANGLETAMALFMIASSVWYYLARVRPEVRPPASRFLILGLLLGVCVVSRIDGVFLALVLMADYLVLLRRRRAPARHLAGTALIPVGVAVLYGPWVVFNIIESGTILQDSGTATRFLSLAYASYFHYGSESLGARGPDIPFMLMHLEHAVSSLKVIPPVQVFFRAMEKIDAMLGSGSVFRTAGNLAGFLVMLAAGIGIYGWRRDAVKTRRSETFFMLVYSGVLMLAYSLYIFGAFFFLRYFFPVYFTACLYLAFFLQDGFDRITAGSIALRRMAYSAAAVYLCLFAIFAYSQAFRSFPIYPYYDIAEWVEEHTRKDEEIGVFQCGTIGYLCDRRIVNLDGKVNRDALRALKSGKLTDYLREEGIDLVVDHSKVIELFLGFSPGNMKDSCTRIYLGKSYPHCDWYAVSRTLLDRWRRADSASGTGPSASAINLHHAE